MPINVLFPQRRVKLQGEDDTLAVLEIDATTSEDHSSTFDITDHPIEKGADISDHVRQKPRTLVLSGVVSNTPLEFLNIGSFDGTTRDVDTWRYLKELQAKRVPITVTTTLEEYDNMFIHDVRAPRDASTGNSLHFTITFRELNIVESGLIVRQEVVTRPPGKDIDKGGKEEIKDQKLESVANKIKDGITEAARSLF